MNNLKRFLFAFVLIGSFVKAQTVFIGSNVNEKITLKTNTYIHIDGLTINPTADFNIVNNTISKLGTTSNTISSSINRSYYFNNSTASFTGSLKIAYQDSELNGETESDLKLVLFSSNQFFNQTTISSNTFSNFLVANVTNKSFNEITLFNHFNTAPTYIALSSHSVNENVATGTTVGGFTSTDVDSGDTFTYTLVSGDGSADNNSFSISGTNLLTAAELDFETKSSYSIRIQTSDGSGTYEKAFTITVEDLFEFALTSSTPATASNTVSLDSDIKLTFDSPVKTSTLNASNIVITGKNTGIISGTFSGGGTTSVVFNPTNDFKPGEVITVTLTSGLQNTSNASLTTPHTFSFTTKNASMATPFFTTGNIGQGFTTFNVFAADIDGDDDMDIVSASNSTIKWFESNGASDPSWTANNIDTGIGLAHSVFASDIDGDGDMDIVSASMGDNTIAWYENDGASDPSWTTNDIDTNLNGAHSVYAADMDGDGDMDIVTASYANNTIAWYENDGTADPSWTRVDIDTNRGFAHSVFAADIDGDGDMDIVSASGSGDHIVWYENNGASDPSWTAAVIDTNAPDARFVFAADMDGDGDMDVLSASHADDTIAWYENDGNANPTFTAADIATSADAATAVFAADIDGDGDMDILSASRNDNTIAWYENDGASDPSWTAADIDTDAEGANSVFAADMDGDGDIDIISGSSKITWYETESPNAAPSDITLSSSSVDENVTIGTTVGSLSTTDSDSGDTHAYTLVAGSGDPENGSFSISGANLLTGTALDYETKNSYSIRVQTSDGAATYAKTFTITVADIFEDADGDGISDQTDNCQSSANPNQADADSDGIGDVCDSDIDGDGFANSSDNCPSTVNLDQADFDADGSGDLCDQDDDNDGVLDTDDAFPLDETEIVDTDSDGIGNNADLDDDNDGVLDNQDAFPLDETETIDTDNDGIGNNADLDDDNDSFEDTLEEECDTNPLAAESFPSDFDNDDSPDCLDLDDDNDGVIDEQDVFPLDATETIDTDNDGLGNNADQDDDNDTYLDSNDAFPLDSSEWIDTDTDGLGNNEDLNDDDDYCLDEDDNFPLDSSLCIDTDGDGIDNSFDFDIDGDGVWNDQDDFPLDASESKDTDGDGIGDNTDPDINNDGFPEGKLFISGVLTPQSRGLESTWKIINIEMYPYSWVKVFSPDGSLVFKDINYKNDWNGTHYKTGKALPTGPYLYQVYIGEKEEPLTGWVYIFN